MPRHDGARGQSHQPYGAGQGGIAGQGGLGIGGRWAGTANLTTELIEEQLLQALADRRERDRILRDAAERGHWESGLAPAAAQLPEFQPAGGPARLLEICPSLRLPPLALMVVVGATTTI